MQETMTIIDQFVILITKNRWFLSWIRFVSFILKKYFKPKDLELLLHNLFSFTPWVISFKYNCMVNGGTYILYKEVFSWILCANFVVLLQLIYLLYITILVTYSSLWLGLLYFLFTKKFFWLKSNYYCFHLRE
jgi:hypothetical protein